MKARIKIGANDSNMPVQFWGKTVDIDVTNICFPGGVMWCVAGSTYDSAKLVPTEDEQASETKQAGSPVENLFGKRLESMTVNFYQEKNP